MRDLGILADDLTGALDTAAAFASIEQPVEAAWHGFSGDRSVVDSETRVAEPANARQRVVSLLPELAESRTAMKKLDSLMRGNSFTELAACCTSGRFDAIYVAPAFPAQGRVTAGGRQIAIDGAAGTPVTPPMTDMLAAEGVSAVLVRSPDQLPRRGVAVCDAASEQDLDDIVAAGRSGTSRILWCGSAGLAQALAGRPAQVVAMHADLVIIGSRHHVTSRHVASLRHAIGPLCVSLASIDAVASAVTEVAAALRTYGRAVLTFDLPPLSAAEADTVYRATFSRLRDSIPPPGNIVVVGGDTAYRLMRALGATSLSVVGQRAPGVPVSRIRGGAWSGASVISKSGAFADAGLFSEFIHEDRQSA